MRHLLIAASVLLALAGRPCIAADSGFQYSRDATTPALNQEELISITLDSAVYESTQSGLSDIRLFDGLGEAVPYILRRPQTTRSQLVRTTWAARNPAVRPLEDGGLEITIRLANNDPQPRGFAIVSPLRDFEHRVRVYSSSNGTDWTPVGEEAAIFDYSRYMDVRNDEVQFAPIENRHFRIVIDDITAEQESELLSLTRRLRGVEETDREERVTIARRPFRIERIEFWGDGVQQRAAGDRKVDYPLHDLRVEQDPNQQRTRVYVRSGREPLTALEVATPARNFSRGATVEIQETIGKETVWRPIGQATLSRIDFKSLQREHLAIDFPETRATAYRLVIENRDSPPLDVTAVTARGNAHELVFLAAPDSRYQLAYGAAAAPAPQYDTTAINAVLAEGFQPTPAELGPVVVGALPAPVAAGWSDLLNSRPLLLSVIGLLAIFLAWGLYHAMKRVDSLPSE